MLIAKQCQQWEVEALIERTSGRERTDEQGEIWATSGMLLVEKLESNSMY